MKKTLKFLAVILGALLVLIGCGGKKDAGEQAVNKDGTKQFTAFNAVPGTEVPDNSRLNDVFAKEFGWRVKVSWLTGQTAKERIGVMVAGGEYPDLVDASDGRQAMIDAGAYVPLEDYLDDYPNLKATLSDEQWEKIKADNDGHIYTIPQFAQRDGMVDLSTQVNGEAFWIQKRVLKWANYPEIKTVDEYFKLINDYMAEHPTTDDGQSHIGFEIISDDWRSYALTNPPMFLAGYPNDGAAIVDLDTRQAKLYDLIPEAKTYYKILSEQYAKGVIDPETFTAKYDQYIAKLSSGRVIGFVDQGWNIDAAENSLISQGKDDLTWAPLDLTIDPKVQPQYREGPVLNTQGGIGITVSCKDVKGALQMLDDMTSEKGMILRNWGEEGTDYHVDENGMFYRTDEQWKNWKDTDYVNKNSVAFGYMPGYKGYLPDGKNAVWVGEQQAEFEKTLSDIDKELLKAYNVPNFNQMLRLQDPVAPWFPIYTASNKWTTTDPAGLANQSLGDIRMKWLPKIIIDGPDAFEENWKSYAAEFEKVDYKAIEKALTKEVDRRYKLEQEIQKKVD